MSTRTSDSGFTLLEVMVSLAIIATALVTLMGTHLMSLNLAQKNKEQTLEAMMARQKMEEMFATPFASINNDSGDFAPEHPECGWEIFVEEAGMENLKNVKIIVSSPGGSLTLQTSVAEVAVE